MPFAIIISEKGGQERREVFDKNEISIGRVQGNDLLLPKGNVSKRHARIVYRDGRFIVTDLKSTNGSYVNGHRIAQATIVREGDKIYIGDFILKVDAASVASSGSSNPGSPREDRRAMENELPGALRSDVEGSVATPPPRGQESSAVSHIPLEQDPDDPSMTGMPVAPYPGKPIESRPPRPPAAPASPSQMPGRSTVAGGSAPAPVGPAPVVSKAVPTPAPSMSPAVSALPSSPAAVSTGKPSPAPAAGRPREATPVRPATGAASSPLLGPLAALLTRLADVIELDDGDATPSESKRASIERVLREQARAMQTEGEITGGLNVDELVRAAAREAIGTGPLEPLLEDDDVLEIRVAKFDQISVLRSSGPAAVANGFSSEASLRRAIGRLAAGGRNPGPTLTARVVGGAQLSAVFPPVAASGTTLVIRKRRRTDLSLDELVRGGTVSRGMAAFLQHCLQARANILIAGPLGAGTTTLMSALAAACGADERVVAVSEIDEIVIGQVNGTTLLLPDSAEVGGRVVRLAASLRPDRLFVASLAGDVIPQVVEAIGDGADSVIAGVRGPSLRHALARLAPALSAARTGLDAAGARSWIAASFDVAIEVARLPGGRHRVLRMAELTIGESGELAPRDIFELALDPTGAGEGTFAATGVVPALVADLRARGHRVDDSVYRRGAR